MATPILATKLYVPPPRPSVVARPRLIEQLTEGLTRKLTLIAAPAGFGKTTLISEWVAGCQRSAAWLSLDESDTQLTRFLAYVVAALQTAQPSIGQNVLGMLQSSPPVSTEAILTELLNQIAALPAPIVLIIDDYHVINSKPIDHALAFLLEHLPPSIHLVIAARGDPQLPLARLRAQNQLTELRAADLRFTAAEAADFFNQIMGLSLTGDDIAALESRTEGWIAGLQLAAISMQGHQDIDGFIKSFTGNHRFVMDYLVEEVLNQQPKSIQAFLLRTSILDRMCGALCDAVLAGASVDSHNRPINGQEALEILERASLFIVPLDSERRWYRYHHLFAELLRQRLLLNEALPNPTFVPATAAELRIRASQWHEQNGLPDDAIRYALSAADFERAARLLELAWPRMDGRFQSEVWLGWARALPPNLVRAWPILCAGYAWSLLNLGELEAGEAWLLDAEKLLDSGEHIVGKPGAHVIRRVVVDESQFRSLPASIATARAYIAQARGDSPGTVYQAQRALELLPSNDHLKRGPAAALLGLAQWASGDLEAAHDSIASAMSSFQQAGHLNFALSCTYGLADIRVTQGRLHEAVGTYERSLQLALKHGMQMPRGTADLYLGLSELHHEQGDLAGAERLLGKSQELGEQAALPDWPYRFCRAQAGMKKSHGDLDGALDRLDQAERLYFRSPVPEVRPLPAIRARAWLSLGRVQDALNWVRERGLSVDDDLHYLAEFEHITLTRVLLALHASGQDLASIRSAQTLLGRLLQTSTAGGRTGTVIEIHILQALALQAQGDMPAALAILEQALTLAEPEGYIRVFADEGQPMARLLSAAAGRTKLPGYIATLLAAFGQQNELPKAVAPPISSAAASPLIDPLSQRELEVLQLIAHGLSNQAISARLVVALTTVKGHNQRIFDKLQVRSRTEAIARARELGLL